ncbi:MAG TPA: nuclear transport factor 2 family protein [Solirubrobacteraceae bacterium]|jgi:ketosteroid isomerase-like protein|nr:nuclear transport factor 2 family protein [Solirubrobacteraceae bacterium]
MSRENVKLVRALQFDPDVDLAEAFRDDAAWAELARASASLFHSNFVSTFPGLLDDEKTYPGLDGLRAGWLAWLAPWATYRAEIIEAIDCGDRVLLLVHDFGRREGSAEEIRGNNAAVWTVREGKIARAEFHTGRDEALKAVGLEE